ncbi:MAG: YjfI family protein [Methylococcales bacterium]
MIKKTSAHYQREFRRRLREQGLVKKEIWIQPEHALKLNTIEHTLREADSTVDAQLINAMTKSSTLWTTITLFDELQQAVIFSSHQASIELMDGIDPVLQIVMHEYGDLPIFLSVYGEQIIVESVLWSTSDVNNLAEFNEVVLRTHKYFPLSTISLDKRIDGVDYYHMFGALSSASSLSNIVIEIEVLASNVIKVTEAYSDYLATTNKKQGDIK